MKKIRRLKLIIGTVLSLTITAALFSACGSTAGSGNAKVTDFGQLTPEGEAQLILDTDLSDRNALLRGDGIYIPYDIAADKLNKDFYDDEDPEDKSLTYVLPKEIIRIYPDRGYYMSNDEKVYTNDPILITENGVTYIELAFLAGLSDMRYEFHSDPDRVIIHYQWIDFLHYMIETAAPVYVSPDLKSDVAMVLDANTEVHYIGGYGNKKSDFIKIMTDDGLFGYIQRKHIGSTRHVYQASSYTEPASDFLLSDEKLKLGWWYVATKVGNSSYDDVTKETHGMNVICPTWISLADNDGGITSFAEGRYVGRAHAAGYKVWILVDFPDGVVSPHQNLSRNSARDVLIKNLVNEAVSVGADGLNIDFEALSVQTGVHFVQFIKELSVRCHQAGLILSVDNLVPMARTAHYDIETQAKYADYIVVMAYDEHYATSPEAGSVASIGFVRDAIDKVAEVCDRNRIILGLPFYTRLWKSTNGELTSEALTIKQMEKYIKEKKLEKVWDEKTCQNYVEYSADGTGYRMWCEDTKSLAYKCADAKNGELGGVAGWRLGFENADVWSIINQYIE